MIYRSMLPGTTQSRQKFFVWVDGLLVGFTCFETLFLRRYHMNKKLPDQAPKMLQLQWRKSFGGHSVQKINVI